MKLFIAAIGTETNTFSPIPTGRAAFVDDLFVETDASRRSEHWFAGPLKVWRTLGEAAGYEVVQSLAAFAPPGGPTRQDVWEELRDRVLSDLKAAGPVDLVLFNLHGAMIADAQDDCEGELVTAAREIVGPSVTIGVELDLHCHLTDRIVAASDVLLTYKEYPHIDVDDRARDLFRLCDDARAGRTRPTIAVADCRMLAVWRTPNQPTRGFVDRMSAAEGRDGILSLSLAHGFPWADIPDVGAKVVAVTDGDPDLARRKADALARELWEMREATTDRLMTLDEAVGVALAPQAGVTVLADVSNNAGAGSASDATFLLRALVEAGATACIIGSFWDPVAVRLCREAGAGARLPLRIGGKTGPMSGEPVDLNVRVLGIRTDAIQTYGNGKQPMGDCVLVEAGGLHILLNTLRTQVFHPEAFEQLGVSLNDYATVFVKSAQHFNAAFAPRADRIHYVAVPGSANPDFAALRLPKAARPLWPIVADPFEPRDGA
ncbi:M81 family metallopeptidase [Methylobacterium terricola]|uniref:Microcystinase C n=1 Tax=Methylobacterium terricola TaxID=2583531 RepID=A0A5C4LP92_9HYPH|nr:M81 family metallopeptidase [Methylobacterium terricola]TNC14439.1 M81 family metallopeptidase [Methylobacterium terricola]